MNFSVWTSRILIAGCGAWALPAMAAAVDSTEITGELVLADFTAAAWTNQIEGTLLWLTGPRGTLRLEAREGCHGREPSIDLARLLHRKGNGWTAVVSAQDNGTINRWGEEWRRAPRYLRPLVLAVTQALRAGPPFVLTTNQPWRAGKLGRRLTKQTSAGAEPSFRRQQSHRGRGRGGLGTVVLCTWHPATGDEPPLLTVNLSQRPGEISLSIRTVFEVRYADPESFVPMWPLASMLRVGRVISVGTYPHGRGSVLHQSDEN